MTDPQTAEVEPAPSAPPPAPAGVTGAGGTVTSGPAGRAGPLVITVIGRPAPQGSKRYVGKGVMVESSKRLKPWREAVKEAAFGARNAHPFSGPVTVEIAFCFTKPKSAPKRRRTWPTTRASGDVDKLSRACLDALTDAAVFRDDSQVVRLVADKYFTDDPDAPLAIPGAVIAIKEITE